jgi:hypothetical protein
MDIKSICGISLASISVFAFPLSATELESQQVGSILLRTSCEQDDLSLYREVSESVFVISDTDLTPRLFIVPDQRTALVTGLLDDCKLVLTSVDGEIRAFNPAERPIFPPPANIYSGREWYGLLEQEARSCQIDTELYIYGKQGELRWSLDVIDQIRENSITMDIPICTMLVFGDFAEIWLTDSETHFSVIVSLGRMYIGSIE